MDFRNQHFNTIAKELAISAKQVEVTVNLLEEGATIPFISRYRKELTSSLDEIQIASIRDRFEQLKDLEKRRDAILKSLSEMGILTMQLESLIRAALSLAILEDIYLPYKPKRKTRASMAKAKGLQPLADRILKQDKFDLMLEASKYIDVAKGVASSDEALSGARDILAEFINEHAPSRAQMRKLFLNKGVIDARVIKGMEEKGIKYQDYYNYSESIKTIPSHRVLAIRRGEKGLFLSVDIYPPQAEAIEILERQFIKSTTEISDQVQQAIEDSYKRLLKPSLETEIRSFTKQKADEEAIKVFTENCRQLLLAPPLGQKRVLAIDPGFRTGCKVVCLDAQGKLLENTAIFPHTGSGGAIESEKTLKTLVAKHKIEAIAIGNGTAGRETETFVSKLKLEKVLIVMVNESGASIYSASDVAREEFPDKDITVRGAVSIGRRLTDPLAELVKIDPKSIGVGQYQHDVDQTKLQTSLDDTIISCVNAVGVELNTASKQILSYISGLGPQIAQNIVDYRNQNGPFKSRSELKKVPRLGNKAFEQATGFLRIRDSKNPLDASSVHPERYTLVEQMAKDLTCKVSDLIKDQTLRNKINIQNYVSDSVGLPTLKDILSELAKPGRDPREQFETFSFTEGVNSIADLQIGMTLPGIVTNITNFGAFVDIGVHQDGLVHLSQMANRFLKDPNEVVKVYQQVLVTVMEVDAGRKRISLSMKTDEPRTTAPRNITIQKIEVKEVNVIDKLAALKAKFS